MSVIEMPIKVILVLDRVLPESRLPDDPAGERLHPIETVAAKGIRETRSPASRGRLPRRKSDADGRSSP